MTPTLEQIARETADAFCAAEGSDKGSPRSRLLQSFIFTALQAATKQPQGADWAEAAAKECCAFSEKWYRGPGKDLPDGSFGENIAAIIRKHTPLVANREDSERLEYKWIIPHPGTLEWIDVPSFEEAMEKWFEGFNVPCLITNGKKEDFPVSHARVKKYFNDRAAMRPAQPERGRGEGTP